MNAFASRRHPRPTRQDGVAAVELAILSVLIFWFMASALFIARSVMQATVVQRAANNGAHMIANYPQYLRSDPSSNLDDDLINMATEQLLGSGIPASAIGGAGSNCGTSLSCTTKAPPTQIVAAVSVTVVDPSSVLPTVNTLSITASSSDRYAN